MDVENSIVYVVDDDPAILRAVDSLLSSVGQSVATFGSVKAYLAHPRTQTPACLILDVKLPDISGMEFQRQVDAAEHPPIVFITGHGDIPMSVRAMKAGAVDFLPKPFSQKALLGAVRTALEQDRSARHKNAELLLLRDRYAQLTPREQEVFPLVVSGYLNKQAAQVLGISEVTLQLHRRRVIHKMGASSLADLVRMAERLGLFESQPEAIEESKP
jgi:FixJ family two-component response regulator